MMTSKERLLRALNKEKPDRLPGSCHQWQKFHLDRFLGGISPLEAFAKFGLDAQIQYFGDTGQSQVMEEEDSTRSTGDWRNEPKVLNDDPESFIVQHTIHTPSGTLSYRTESNSMTTWVLEYMVKRDEDIDIIEKHMPVPTLNVAEVGRLYDQVGDAGILRGFVWGDQAGCWQHAGCLMDMNGLIMKAIDQPDWVHRFMKILLEKKLRFVETMKGARFDLVETGGGAGSSTVISPKFHEEFCLPYDKPIHDALHDLGFKVTYHTCGGTLGIEEYIVANGCDASETLAPKSVGSNQEPWDFARKINGRVALIGGIDQFNVVTDGSPELIRKKVHEVFEKVGANGGYICALSDHFFETPVENLQAFADAVRECEY